MNNERNKSVIREALPNKNEVFISYSRKDFEKVRAVKKEIDKLVGIDCWMDLDGIESGERFKKVIISAINRHDALLFMLTPQSMSSPFALKELGFAASKGKRIILVDLAHTQMNDEFLFDYSDKDVINWNDSMQRCKLIKDLQRWYGKLIVKKKVLCPVKIDNLYGLMDKDKNVVVKGTWLSIGQFHNGIAFAQSVDGKYGMINHFGQLVVPYQWTHVDDSYEGITKVQGENKKYGFVNSKGEIISKCIWDLAEHFSEGFACVVSAKESGFIDCTGRIVIPYNEGKMTSFSEGLACVSNSVGKWGYINKEGKMIIPWQWTIAYPFKEGLACVFCEKFGFINEKGDYEIPCVLDGAGSFGNGLAPAYNSESNLWGYIDKKGNIVIDYKWISARSFHEGLACVEENGVYGFINPEGKLVIPRRFLEAGDFKDGYAEIKDCVETRCNYVDKNGNLI